ncbi:MAG: hypothetical protein ACRCTA_05435, partial [Bacilli bacterium]
MKFSDYVFQKIMGHDIRNFQWGQRNYDLLNVITQLNVDEYEDFYHFRAIVNDSYGEYDVDIKASKDMRQAVHECDCWFHTKSRACGHIFATMLLVNKIDIGKLPYDYVFEDKSNLDQIRRKLIIEERERIERESRQRYVQKQLDRTNVMLDLFKKDINRDVFNQVASQEYLIKFELHKPEDIATPLISLRVGTKSK